MKPILLGLLFWGCVAFIHTANASGNYVAGYFDAHLPALHNADTTTTNNSYEQDLALKTVIPAPGAKLNYTQIMFEHPVEPGADAYLLEVFLNTGTGDWAHPLFAQKDSSAATMIGNLEFGKKYVWRYTGLQNGKQMGWKGPYYFETLTNPRVDSTRLRARVLQNDSLQNNGGLLVLDLCGSIIDRKGNPVWFFPMQFDVNDNTTLRSFTDVHNSDLQLTPQGTITSIINHKAQERDLNGNIIWQAPRRLADKSDSLKYVGHFAFHHCFKKLASGNYMVIDQDNLSVPDSALGLRHQGAPYNVVARTSTGSTLVADEILKEFDHAGNLVWTWSSETYFTNAELSGMVQSVPDTTLINREPGGHMNAFEVDEKNGFVYAGFRNVNRVIKIEKSTGKVVCAWGDNMQYNGKPNGQGFFLKQHGITLLRDGNLAVYNNNPQPKLAPGESAKSEVVVFSQPHNGTPGKVVWRYDCNFDSTANMSSVSGNVDELKNGNLLVCMGAVNRIFEVTRNKKVVWNALIENHNGADPTWYKFALYRAHYASSLYPCYFTVQCNKQVIANAQPSYRLKIFNDGSEDDSYSVEITSPLGKKQFLTAVLNSKKSINLTLAGQLLPAHIIVTSTTNSSFVRVVDIE